MRIFGWTRRGTVMWGIFLVLVGTCILLGNYGVFSFPFKLARDWPVILIAWGVLKIIDVLAERRSFRPVHGKEAKAKDYKEVLRDLEEGNISTREAIHQMKTE